MIDTHKIPLFLSLPYTFLFLKALKDIKETYA